MSDYQQLEEEDESEVQGVYGQQPSSEEEIAGSSSDYGRPPVSDGSYQPPQVTGVDTAYDSQQESDRERLVKERDYQQAANASVYYDEADRINDAAIFLYEGYANLKYQFHPTTPYRRKLHNFLHSQGYYLLEITIALIFQLLVLFEYPAVIFVPRGFPESVEFCCIIFFLFNYWMRYRVRGEEIRLSGQVPRLILLFIVFVDWVLYVSISHKWRVLRLVRPFYLADCAYAAGVRRVLRQILHTLWTLWDMMLMLLLYILLWSILGFYYFGEQKDNTFFSSFEQSFIQLFIGMTTANYPDVSMAAFYHSSAAPLFFVIYQLLGLFFIFQLFLAVVFNQFADKQKGKFKRIFVHKRQALRAAYTVARGGEKDGLRFDDFRAVVKKYKLGASNRKLLLTFSLMDKDQSGSIELKEFYHLYDALKLKWKVNLPPDQIPARFHDKLPVPLQNLAATLRRIIATKAFEIFITLVILANLIVTVVLAVVKGRDDIRATYPHEYAFYAIYLVEAMIKVFALGPRRYFERAWNVFDFFIVAANTIGVIVQASVKGARSGTIGIVVRSLRLLRLVRLRQTFQNVMITMYYLLPKMGRYLVALCCLYYSFAVVGMACFAFTVSEDCKPTGTVECGTAYDSVFYGLNNFNNVLYSYNTLFDLMVVNNWFEIMEGHVAVTTRWARTYFFIWYLIGVIGVSNVITAFILDAFQNTFPFVKAEQDHARGKQLQGALHQPLADEEEGKFYQAFIKRETLERVEPKCPFLKLKLDVFEFRAKKKFGQSVVIEALYGDEIKEWLEEDEELAINPAYAQFRSGRRNTSVMGDLFGYSNGEITDAFTDDYTK